ncbi:MAG: VWA domain-containing protein, partial [Lutimonas sp.]
MQFTHPEILALLFVLIIPILIHLFQLQRFKKEAFTNVKFLRQIELESRKSSRLKKLLILASRLLALTCLILAFAQPVLRKTDTQENRKTIIYLDNSLSMQATDNNGSELLQNAKRLLIDNLQSLPGDFALITNDNTQESLQSEGIRQELTKISYHPVRKDLTQILLEAQSISTNKNYDGADVFLFSDFRNSSEVIDSLPSGDPNRYFLVPMRSDRYENLSLDSLWISAFERNELKLKGRVLSQEMEEDNLSVSLVLNGELFGKSSLSIEEDNYAYVEFSLPPETTGNGAMIFSDPRLGFDNSLFFTLPKSIKPKVLVIGPDTPYLRRIYTSDSFEVTFQELSNLNQGGIQDYDLILLNELENVPAPLARSLKAYVQDIGNLVIIPSAQPDLASYQSMLSVL